MIDTWRGLEFLEERCQEGCGRLTYTDPLMAYNLMQVRTRLQGGAEDDRLCVVCYEAARGGAGWGGGGWVWWRWSGSCVVLRCDGGEGGLGMVALDRGLYYVRGTT